MENDGPSGSRSEGRPGVIDGDDLGEVGAAQDIEGAVELQAEELAELEIEHLEAVVGGDDVSGGDAGLAEEVDEEGALFEGRALAFLEGGERVLLGEFLRLLSQAE